MTVIFKKSMPGRVNAHLCPQSSKTVALAAEYLRQSPLNLPEVSELDVVRHYTRLSQQNFSIDTHFYPLGSCTMKYNPRACHCLASLPAFQQLHPSAPAEISQGTMACLYDLQSWLARLLGMDDVCLTPMAGAQGEFVGVSMIAAYHRARGDNERCEIIVPDAAHGTNPASAIMCGYSLRNLPTKPDGDVDLDELKLMVGPKTAGIMLTNPSTLGVFERDIQSIAELLHKAGGLMYYDGANLNAIMGHLSLQDMGFDVVHLNLHKTFATPHGSGGPGSGPVVVTNKLAKYLPVPRITKTNNSYVWLTEKDCPDSIGQLSAFSGNTAVLLRAYAYIALLGREGLVRVADFATLNANYLLKRLTEIGYQPAFTQRLATHEFCLSLSAWKKDKNITATDLAKALLDLGFHAPTVYFPLLVPECLLIEPTETESLQTLDKFIAAMQKIYDLYMQQPERLQQAPITMPVSRLDEVRAAKEPDLRWTE